MWHPYASAAAPPTTYRVAGAHGVTLELEAAGGERFDVIDAMSSWWSAIHGYRHPHLDTALHAQADAFAHVMFGGLTHDPAITLGERLCALTGMDRVFLADSGSVSVEVALKMAIQAQSARDGVDSPPRTQFLTIRGGYHGDTTGAMSVCDPVGGLHALFRGALAPQVFAPTPPPWRPCLLGPASAQADKADVAEAELAEWAARFRAVAAEHAGSLAGVIVEPVLQGAGGMRPYDPRALTVMREVCDELGLLLILDEIATGFHRTGAPWGASHAGVRADIVCVGKALTGGYLSLAATLCTAEVAALVSRTAEGSPSALMHGPTFMGNPLACAVANASLDLIEQAPAAVLRLEAALRRGLGPLAALPGVAEARVLGAVGVLVMEHPASLDVATRAALEAGVWIRPFGRLLYTMPPYIASDAEVARICAALGAAATASHAQAGGDS
ncbi:adenosylmethionine--8-amino-7-oxononanoate transaminase [Micrococcales bacterium 31B]|nr:adenosylmethionine--8-amino-7-oxononanoate transaminase [Micrococcales bacterium 31B]